MSLTLSKSKDINVFMQSNLTGQGVKFLRVGDREIDIDDFCQLVSYVMTNTDLDNYYDPRVILQKEIASYEKVEGWKGDKYKRFESPEEK